MFFHSNILNTFEHVLTKLCNLNIVKKLCSKYGHHFKVEPAVLANDSNLSQILDCCISRQIILFYGSTLKFLISYSCVRVWEQWLSYVRAVSY